MEQVWSLFNVHSTKLSSQVWVLLVCKSVGMLCILKRHQIPPFCVMLFIVLRPVGLGVEKNTATSSLKFLLLRGWIWQKFLRFPYTSGDTYAVTWRCCLYRYWLSCVIFYGFTVSQTLYITLIKLFSITYPWNLLFILHFTDEYLLA